MPFVAVIFSLIILLQLSTDLYLPSMPMIGSYFQVSSNTIQLTLSSFVAGMALSHLLFGPLSDKYGRKTPMMVGVSISIIGSLICLKAPSALIFTLGRFMQGLGIGCINSVGRSCVRDRFHGIALAKMGSIVGMLSILLMIGSPTLGGYIAEHYGWSINFMLLIAVGLLVLGLMMFFLPDTNTNRNQDALQLKTLFDSLLTLIKNKHFVAYTLASCLASGGVVAWFTLCAYILKDSFDLSPTEIGIQNLYIALAVFCSSLMNILLIKKMGIKKMVLLGCLSMALGGGLLLFFLHMNQLSLIYLMVSLSLFATGCGFVFINAFAGAFEAVAKIAGMAGMAYALFQDGFASLTSIFIASDGYNNIQMLGTLLLIIGLFSFLLVYKIPKPINLNEEPL